MGKWIAPLCGTAAGLLIYFVYNWVRFADAFNFGQPGHFSLSVAPIALAGLLTCPGTGLLWYCPAVIAVAGVPAATFKRWESALIMAVAGAYLAEHAVWGYWDESWSWGPRLLLPAVPGLMALTALLERRRRWLLIALTIAGFVVNAPTLISFYERYYQEASGGKNQHRGENMESPLRGGVSNLGRRVARDRRRLSQRGPGRRLRASGGHCAARGQRREFAHAQNH